MINLVDPKSGRKYGTVWTMLLGSVGCFLTAVFDYLENENPENSSYGILKATCAFAGKFGVAGTFGIGSFFRPESLLKFF